MTRSEIESCADKLGADEKFFEEQQKRLDAMLPDEIAAIAKDASQWIVDEVSDPTKDLAAIYRHAAQYWNSPEQIGVFVKYFLDMRVTSVLEARLRK